MIRYIGRRLVMAIPVLLGTSFLIFAMVYALPGDPIRALAGDQPLPPEVVGIAKRIWPSLDKVEAVDRYGLVGRVLRFEVVGDDARALRHLPQRVARLRGEFPFAGEDEGADGVDDFLVGEARGRLVSHEGPISRRRRRTSRA